MEIEHVWTLAGFLGASAFALTLKLVESSRKLQFANDEISSLRKELNTLKQEHKKCILDSQKLKSAKESEFLKPIHYDTRGIV
jgi:hypothetical protein